MVKKIKATRNGGCKKNPKTTRRNENILSTYKVQVLHSPQKLKPLLFHSWCLVIRTISLSVVFILFQIVLLKVLNLHLKTDSRRPNIVK